MYEGPAHQKGGPIKTIADAERLAWLHLRQRFKLEDRFKHIQGHLSYSWVFLLLHCHDPAHQARDNIGVRRLWRLDRIYSYDQANSPLFSIQSTILPGLSLSDHAPVSGTLTITQVPHRSSQFQMNTAHLRELGLQQRFTSMWGEEEEKALFACIDDQTFFVKGCN
jgi:hypothetical protein